MNSMNPSSEQGNSAGQQSDVPSAPQCNFQPPETIEGEAGTDSLAAQSTSPGDFKQVRDQGLVPTDSGTAMDDTSYDLISILYHKAKAIQAYETYLKDVQSDNRLRQLLVQIRHEEQQHISQLKNHLGRLLIQPSAPKISDPMPGD